MATQTAPGKPSLAQMNMAARQAILAQALEMKQNIASVTVTAPGSTANVINIIPRNVGLIKRFIVEITATLSNSGTTSVTLTNFNIANLLSQVVYNDLNNLTRIQTTGAHLSMINTVRNPHNGPYGAALIYGTGHDVPIKYGSNYVAGGANSGQGLFQAAASIATTSTSVVKMTYEIPLAYSDRDLRGAVYSNVLNATQLLQLTLNPAPIVAATADGTNAIYQGTSGAGTILAATINVYQVFLDQLPTGKQGPVLPIQDLATVYELKNTTLTGMVQNQDFPIQFANFRDFLSLALIWDNGGTLTAGTDISYFALQSANFTNIFKIDPFLASLFVRKRIEVDFPTGAYYFDFRDKPLATIQYGNLELIQNISAAINSGAQDLVFFEDFGLINSLTGAGSLPAG